MLNSLQIYRNDQPYLLIPIDEKTEFFQAVMGDHVITTQFISPVPLDIDEGDYILFRGERFTINRPLPPLDKTSLTEFTYNLTFEGYVYDLLDMPYMHLGSLEFSYFGTPAMYLQILVDCMNSISSGWSVGAVDALPEQPLDFYESGKGFSCKGALIKIAEAFKLEFWLTGKTINLTAQAGVLTNLTFEYGRGRGLYKISRGQINDTAYFNRLYVQGSDKNIPSGYRGGAKRLQVGNDPYLELPLTGGKKRRANSIVIDDIFPKRVGTITAVSADWLTITDTAIDFDVNGQRIDGQKATVEITSGENAGQSFEIDSYVHATRTIKLLPLTETDGYVRPNSTYSIAVGDKYFFAGINMPQTYIDAAEKELRDRGTTLLNTAANQLPPYSVEVSDKFMRDNGITVNAGDRVGLKDAQIGVDAKIRVSSVRFPLVDPNNVQLVISDVIPLNNTEKTIIDVDKTKRDVVVTTKISAEKARRNMLDMRMLKDKIFDPDGYFDPESIKPLSIDTYMLSVGAKGQNFSLNNVTIDANTGGDPNYLTISGGSLIHYEVETPGLGYVWQISAGEFPALDPAKTYFVSAKCSRNELAGIWSVSEVPIKTEEVSGFYHFNIGILFPVGSDGTRGFDFTNGMTFIVGDRITTGRIQSLDGLNFLDLSAGTFNLGDVLSGLDWSITNEGKLTVRGEIIATDAQFINLAVENLKTGKVKITAENNNIIIEDGDKNAMIILDDDCAVEGYTLSPVDGGRPVIIPVYGPGARFGLSPNNSSGFSSIGRKGLFTNGKYTAGGNGKTLVMDHDGFSTNSGKRTLSGQFRLAPIPNNPALTDNNAMLVTIENGLIVGFEELVDGTKQPMTVNDPTSLPPDNTNDTGYTSGDGGGGIDPPIQITPTTFTAANFPLGLVTKRGQTSNTNYSGILSTHVKRFTIENDLKTTTTRVNETTFNYTNADTQAAWAKENGLTIHGHCLLWAKDAYIPQYIKDYETAGTLTTQQWNDKLKDLIQAPILHYKNTPSVSGVIKSWDVVNEPFLEAADIDTTARVVFKNCVWLRVLGPDYIKLAFQYAYEADPTCIYFLNDYGWEYGWKKVDEMVRLATEYQAAGIPMHGWGLQLHTYLSMSNNGITSNLQRLVDTGLKIHISELAIQLREGTVPNPFVLTPALEASQAAKFVTIFNAFKAIPSEQKFGITTWGIIDSGYWKVVDSGNADYPLLFNDDFTTKQGYRDALTAILT
jgi:GH35 family endo-1,4-beta-xylanase